MFKSPTPTHQMRFKQYNRNLDTLSLLDELTKKPFDWIVTVAFYCALHLIEKNLMIKGKKTTEHSVRNKIVVKQEEFGYKVAVAYDALFKESISARYYCLPIDQKRATDAIGYLRTIESELT